MLLFSYCIVVTSVLTASTHSYKLYNDFQVIEIEEEVTSVPILTGEPLFLTPLIENGEIEKAQELSKVTGLGTDLVSHTGYITVDKEAGGHTFFWYFPSQVRKSSRC